MKLLTQEAALRKRCQRILADHRRRARAEGKTLDYGLTWLLGIVHEARTCSYCRMPIGLDFQLDHRTPIARGGVHETWNLSVTCHRCNLLKGRLTAKEFLHLRAVLAEMHLAASDDITRRLIAGGQVYARGRK